MNTRVRRSVSRTISAPLLCLLAMAFPAGAQASTAATTPGVGKKCYNWEEGDTKYSQGDEWVCVRIGKSWQRKFMWVVYE